MCNFFLLLFSFLSALLYFFHPSYILWFYYTTDGIAVALTVGVLRVQGRRVEGQVPSEGIRVDLRLPVAAVTTPTVKSATIPAEASSAEEGEGEARHSKGIPREWIKGIIAQAG